MLKFIRLQLRPLNHKIAAITIYSSYTLTSDWSIIKIWNHQIEDFPILWIANHYCTLTIILYKKSKIFTKSQTTYFIFKSRDSLIFVNRGSKNYPRELEPFESWLSQSMQTPGLILFNHENPPHHIDFDHYNAMNPIIHSQNIITVNVSVIRSELIIITLLCNVWLQPKTIHISKQLLLLSVFLLLLKTLCSYIQNRFRLLVVSNHLEFYEKCENHQIIQLVFRK